MLRPVLKSLGSPALRNLFALSSLFFSTATLSQANNIGFESFVAGEEHWDYIEIELRGVTNETARQLCLVATARSEDGTVRSSATAPAYLPVGSKHKITTHVFRPYSQDPQQTDRLVIKVYECGHDFFLTRTFPWPRMWPERRASPDSQNYSYLTRKTVKSWEAISETYMEEDFVALDRLWEKWSKTGERDKDGEWKLDGFKKGLGALLANKDWQGNIQRIKKWKAANPSSLAATLAEVHHWVAYAWNVRGNEPASGTDPFAMKLYQERMKRAERLLLNSKHLASGNPLWHETYLAIAIDTNKSRSFVIDSFEEAIRIHPGFLPLYSTMAKLWVTKNGEGTNWLKLDELASLAARMTSATDGLSDYARIYMQANSRLKLEVDIFNSSQISWPKMKKSFDDMVSRYPSPENLNAFALFACRAGDRETFLTIRPRIAHQIVPHIWPSNHSLDLCDRRFMQFS